jgi:UDP-GlcNAc:undecaprenyl-phosphate GlcNAc-1-phosphate transferase
MPDMLYPVLGLLLVGLAISLPLTAWLVRAGRHVGALDSAGAAGHDKTLRAVPNVGGLAIYAAVALPMLAGVLATLLVPAAAWERWLPALVPHLPRVESSLPLALGLLGGMTALHVLGLVDDRRALGALPKIAVQLAVAIVLVVWFDVRLLTLLGTGPSIVVSVVWIVAVTNAFNFMDNMDGLAAGTAAIAGTLFMIATVLNHQWFIAGTLALLVGGLLGFLVFNFPPARIFMGDAGSLVVGFLLAVLTARTTFYSAGDADYALGTAWYGVFMPLVVLAIPLYDFVVVTGLRLAQRKSPFVGDQQHFSHRLVERGLTRRGAVLVIWGATAVTGMSGIALGRLLPWQAALVGAQTILVLALIGLLEHASRPDRSGPERST